MGRTQFICRICSAEVIEREADNRTPQSQQSLHGLKGSPAMQETLPISLCQFGIALALTNCSVGELETCRRSSQLCSRTATSLGPTTLSVLYQHSFCNLHLVQISPMR